MKSPKVLPLLYIHASEGRELPDLAIMFFLPDVSDVSIDELVGKCIVALYVGL